MSDHKHETLQKQTSIISAAESLDDHIDSLEKSVDWACEEIERLRAENNRLRTETMELGLRVENLLYMLRSVTQGRLQ